VSASPGAVGAEVGAGAGTETGIGHRWDKVGLVGAKLDPSPECQTRPNGIVKLDPPRCPTRYSKNN
jgi:hypothetical protein